MCSGNMFKCCCLIKKTNMAYDDRIVPNVLSASVVFGA